jgi:hypothetical protein
LARWAVWACAIGLSACGGGEEGVAGGAAGPTHAVVLEVTGTTTGNVLVSYRSPGGTATGQSTTLPWVFRTEAREGDALFLSAQNDATSRTVTVTIRVDGVPFRTATQSGALVVASASATCC